MRETLSVLKKEWLVESRSPQALFSGLLFSVVTVVAVSFASFGQRPGPGLAAGMLCVALAFATVATLPRTFLTEDDESTFDLIRSVARPEPVYSGKMLFSVAAALVVAASLATVFVALTGVPVVHGGLFAMGLALTAVGMATATSLCGAIVLGAENKWLLVAVLGLPAVLPLQFLAVGCLRVALGGGSLEGGFQSLAGLAGWALASLAGSPWIASQVWKLESGPVRPE